MKATKKAPAKPAAPKATATAEKPKATPKKQGVLTATGSVALHMDGAFRRFKAGDALTEAEAEAVRKAGGTVEEV